MEIKSKIIDGKEYSKVIKITDIKLALYLGNFEDNKYLNRMGTIKHKGNGRFDYANFWVNYLEGDEILSLCYRYEFEKYLKENGEMLLTNFLIKESEEFQKNSDWMLQKKYFRNITDLEENEVNELEELKIKGDK